MNRYYVEASDSYWIKASDHGFVRGYDGIFGFYDSGNSGARYACYGRGVVVCGAGLLYRRNIKIKNKHIKENRYCVKASYSNWLYGNGYGYVRGNKGIYSFYGDHIAGTHKNVGRGVVVCGAGLGVRIDI